MKNLKISLNIKSKCTFVYFDYYGEIDPKKYLKIGILKKSGNTHERSNQALSFFSLSSMFFI